VICQAGFIPPPVHPRGRGEHMPAHHCASCHGGSSPRARGTLCGVQLVYGRGRFIPAGAGNTTARACSNRWKAVHPRGRGEHCVLMPEPRDMDGSSPRARGTRFQLRSADQPYWFIPAGAGNTASRCSRSRARPVHPRGRGEHSVSRATRQAGCGSSPRARGTHAVRQ